MTQWRNWRASANSSAFNWKSIAKNERKKFMATDPLLDFSTSIKRNFITIDGAPYELRHASEFSLLDQHLMMAHGKAMAELKDSIGTDTVEAGTAVAKASGSLDDLFQRIVINGAAVVTKLTDEQKLMVLNCFFAQPELAPKNGKPTPSRMRRGSRDSMAAVPKAG